jgi:hypothetical protein
MIYSLTVAKGAITFTECICIASSINAIWSPCNPVDNGGWQKGDTLIVTCFFNLNPLLGVPPPSTEYGGLYVGACSYLNQNAIQELIVQAKSTCVPNHGQLLGTGITINEIPIASNLFYDAKPVRGTFLLNPAARGKLNNYIYQWIMKYNECNNITDGGNVEIVFGYGDPMNFELDSLLNSWCNKN